MEDPQLKLFTLEEANKLIPRLTDLIQKLRQERERILALEVEIDTLELITQKDESGAAPPLNSKVEEYTKIVHDFYHWVDEVHSYGCFLKDIDLGLVDFYTLYKGRVVYLCWRLGDPQVAYWHEVGRGYLSRQPIVPNDENR